MASTYGLNFGFRRSDESMATREGRQRTPATGIFRIGSLVAIDETTPGFLRVAKPGEVGQGGTVGLLVQEESHIFSIYGGQLAGFDSTRLGTAKPNTLSAIWGGPGVKVWMKNTTAQNRADGRTVQAVTMFDPTGLNIGDYMKWDGAKYVKGTGITDSMLRVTIIDAANNYVEAVLVA